MTSTLESPSTAPAARRPGGAGRDHRVRIRRARHGHRAAPARASTTSSSWSGRTTSAAPGGTTPIPAPPATCSPTSTRSPSRRTPTGRAPTPSSPRSRPTCRPTADRFGVREHCVFGADVTAARWDDAARRWQVTDDGRRVPRAGAGLRRRRAGRPDLPRHPGPGLLRRHGHALGPLGRLATTSPASRSPSSAPAPRRSRSCRPSSRSSTASPVYQRTPAWVVPRTDHPVKPLMRLLYRVGPRPAEGRPLRAVPVPRVPGHRHGQAPPVPQAGRRSWPRRTCASRSATRSCARP